MNDDLRDFEQFMKRRDAAAQAYVTGNFEPLSEIATREGDATFYAPLGGFVDGADAVYERYKQDAGSFAKGSDSRFEILHMGASDGIAYWVGFQRSNAYMRGQAEPIAFNLRVTEIFRREGDDWKLIHRHADSLVSESRPQK